MLKMRERGRFRTGAVFLSGLGDGAVLRLVMMREKAM